MFCQNCNGLLQPGTNACTKCSPKNLEEEVNRAPSHKRQPNNIKAAEIDWETICPTKAKTEKHYQANFSGSSQHQLRHYDCITRSFWNYLRREGWLDICESNNRNWKSMTSKELLAYRVEKFSGLSDRQVRTHDPGFASALERRGLCESLKK